MPHHLATDFLITDNGRARWVRRSDTSGDFVTVEEMTAEPAPPSRPQGVVFESGGGRFNVEEGRQAVAHHRDRFAETLGEQINGKVARREIERFSLVGPPRTLAAIRRKLTPEAQENLVGTLFKDLTKTPDHELGSWLNSLSLE
jgi:protein required for attachment to host cells